MEPVRVILVDSEEVFRKGLAKLLDEQPHIEVVHHCADHKEACEKTREMKPDIVLLDSQTLAGKTADAVREISQSGPDIKVVVITHPEAPADPVKVIKAGAKACLAKTISVADLVKCIELVSSGRIIVSPLVAERLLDQIGTIRDDEAVPGREGQPGLSQREMEIALLIAEGATNKEIAVGLSIAESTVKIHVKNTLAKLELRNRQQLAVYAVLQNWVTASPEDERKGSQPDP